ncbi:hypothetical protein SOVF_098590, partial [Spinacia oleracea]
EKLFEEMLQEPGEVSAKRKHACPRDSLSPSTGFSDTGRIASRS